MSAVAPKYTIRAYDSNATTFAPNNLIAEFRNAKNLGYADYLNDVPEMFVTINQDDPQLAAIAAHKNDTHIKIFRNSDNVWSGFLGEWDANERDVILYGYGHLGLFYFTHSAWNVAYTSAQVNTIVSDELTASKGQTNSLTNWITTGTIEAPVTTSGGATPISLPTYRLFWKRTLFTFRELAALSVGNTTNSIVFEVTPSGTFNFWKNLGQDRTNLMWEYGDSRVSGFTESHALIERRNYVSAAGSNPGSALLRTQQSGTTSVIGKRMEPIFFSWVRDQTELERVAKFRLAMLDRDVPDLELNFHPNSIIPAKATGAGFVLGDRARAKVVRGLTNIDGNYLIRGQQVYYVRGSERVNLLLDERSGS